VTARWWAMGHKEEGIMKVIWGLVISPIPINNDYNNGSIKKNLIEKKLGLGDDALVQRRFL